MAKAKVVFNVDLEEKIKQIAIESIEKNGLDITCPECGKEIHVSFSGDTCKFCGVAIKFTTDSNV